MKKMESKIGTKGWLALGAFVVAWDCIADETLTNAFKRGREANMAATVGSTALVVAHLYDLIPTKLDPIDAMARTAGRIGRR
jgi:hypothetical protein